ncbi:MAG: hypothetical protein NTX25_07715 [Proteobacteria bacterium]|nr:hypothetical protein [Pseudomonadota bacterium]
MPWEISRKIDVRFLQVEEQEEGEVERDLEPSDMDAYYVDDKGVIDLEIVINDFIQTSLPSRLVKLASDGRSCAICHIDLSDKRAYQEAAKPEDSPFAILRHLKLPEE